MGKSDNTSAIEAILTAHHLKRTKARVKLVELIAASSNAIAQPAIARKMKNTGRTTLYRALCVLEEKGVIEKVFDFRGIAYYALALSNPSKPPNRVRLYFNCLICKKMYCLKVLETLTIALRQGFKAMALTICLFGTCPKCRKPL